MFSNQNLMRILIVWAFLTLFIVLALLGAVTIVHQSKLSGGTCSSVGGKWAVEDSEYTCMIDKEKEDGH